MEGRERLYRNTAKVRRNRIIFAVFGVLVVWAARAANADPDHHFHNKAPLYGLVGVVMVVVSLIALLALLWPFLIEVDADGLTLRLRGFTTRLPWESVESLTVVKVGESWDRGSLEIRLAPGVRLRGRSARKDDGRRTYSLLSLDDFTVDAEEVIAVLRRYGGGRVDALEYLQHQATRRAVARYFQGGTLQVDPHLAAYLAQQRRIADEASGASNSSDLPDSR
ncbi:hypothetical protein [Micromonospora sp. B9E7]|uniref:hypothetical protein n=1 Tax=Micromonospora sp. B9E7 TaxID=3153574 RepID=UPI00325C57E5